jgi:hypothetical protein
MKDIYIVMTILGIVLASYGFSGAIDDRIKNGTFRAFLLLIGIIIMALGLLLYGVPHFFSGSS